MKVKLPKPRRGFFFTLILVGVISGARHNFRSQELYFLLGAVLGSYLWEYETEVEHLLHQPPGKPLLRNVLTQIALALASFYALTSSTSLLGAGFAYSLFARSAVEQLIAVSRGESLRSWFWQVNRQVQDRMMKIYLLVMVLILVFASLTLVI